MHSGFNCPRTKFEAICVNERLFMQNFLEHSFAFNFRVTFSTFLKCVHSKFKTVAKIKPIVSDDRT